MPSFDIVSRLDFQEIDNAIGNCLREIGQRYDFKGSKSSIDRYDKEIKVITEDEMKLKQINELIITHFVRRKIEHSALRIKSSEKASGNCVKQIYELIEGIDQVVAKKITTSIKSSKIKVQVKIQGNEVRIDGKKKDHLQIVMTMVKDLKIEQPIQFVNLRD